MSIKRILSLFLAVMMTASCLPYVSLPAVASETIETAEPSVVRKADGTPEVSETESEPTADANHIPGDLNHDNYVNTTDVVLLRRYIAGGYNVMVDESESDLNTDSYVNTTDVVLLRRYVAGGYGVVLTPAQKCEHVEVIDEAKAPTCTETGLTEGKHCSVCGRVLVKQQEIPMIEHSFTAAREIPNGSSYTVEIICAYCELPSGFSATGLYIESENAMYFMECEPKFYFDVVCDEGAAYLQSNIHICETIYKNVDFEAYPTVLEAFVVMPLSENVYRISPSVAYRENQSYSVSLGAGVSFASFPGQTMQFRTDGANVAEYEYNADILFLKKLETQMPGYYPYEFTYDTSTESYTLMLSQKGIWDDSFIGRLLCVGDCTSIEEAELLPASEAVIGKIASIEEVGDQLRMVLIAPTLSELYENLNVSITNAKPNGTIEINEAYREYLTQELLNSESFASAITIADITAENIAQDYGLEKASKEFNLNDLNFIIEANEVDPTEDVEAAFVVNVKVEYKHEVPFKQGDTELGSVTFTITFNLTSEFDLAKIDTNLSLHQVLSRDEILKFHCQIDDTNTITFDMEADLNLSYAVESSSAIYYIKHPKSHKIHRSDCRMIVGYLKDESTHYYTLADVAKIPDYESFECSWCKPFTMSEDVFVYNEESNILHCGNCEHVEQITSASIKVYHTCPVGLDAINCTDCDPQEHIKKLEDYMDESLTDGKWGEVFTAVKDTLEDKLKGNGASPITEDSVPVTTIPIYCFSVPIYVEPQFDFDLQANFALHFDATRKDIFIIDLVHDDKEGYSIKTCHDTVDPNGPDEDDSHFTLDLQGKLRTELGVLVEVRLAFRYTENWCYIGVNGECGLYLELAGVLHMDSSAEDYYAAFVETGIYCEASCVYSIPVLLPANSQTILEKQDFALYKGGDVRAYQSFLADDAEINVYQQDSKSLPDSLLEVSYFDLEDMTTKTEILNWSDLDAYELTFRFEDGAGKAVSYLEVRDGILYLSDNAPEEFAVTMYIGVRDKVVFDNFFDYITTGQENGAAYFMEELAVTVVASPSSDLEFSLNYDRETYSVTGIGTCTDTDIYIPRVYQGKAVTKIDDDAFYGCANLTSITIPDGVTSIEYGAFSGCSSLTSITIPDGVMSIDTYTFEGCKSLISITIPDSVTSIEYGAFSGCSSLTSITIPDSVTSIDSSAFSRCSSLTSITIPDGVMSIDTYTFEGCKSLISITIPDSVTSIGDGAFDGCSSLTTITIPDSVTSIGDWAFNGCSSLTTITIPDSVTSIGEHAFRKCNGLTSIIIPDSVTSIGEGAFTDCNGLTSITIPFVGNTTDGTSKTYFGHIFGTFPDLYSPYDVPTSLKTVVITGGSSIGDKAFRGYMRSYSGLTSITLPDSVTSIGYQAFSSCHGLTSINIPDSVTSIGDRAFERCHGLTSITIPDAVTSIGDFVFYDCESLTSINIPDSVTSIGNSAFYFCGSLTSITFTGTMAQWNAISKGDDWDYYTPSYTIHCTDGDIAK